MLNTKNTTFIIEPNPVYVKGTMGAPNWLERHALRDLRAPYLQHCLN